MVAALRAGRRLGGRSRSARAAPALVEIKVEAKGLLGSRRRRGEFRLKARADRLERHADGRITVIDYKTGLLPERAEVLAGRAPQLPLEAAMVEAGAFEAVGRAAVAELLFWQLQGRRGRRRGAECGRPAPGRARRPGARRTVPG